MENLLLTGAGATLLTLCACQKEEVYSCDPQVNHWAKSNLSAIESMSCSEWVAVNDLSKQRAAYVAFTSQQKIILWKNKINEVLGLDWTNQERKHIEKMLIFIDQNPALFDKTIKNTDAENDIADIELYRWIEYAIESLNWDKKLIGSIIYMPHPLLDKVGTLSLPEPSVPITKGGGG